jgi:hypothetical protein
VCCARPIGPPDFRSRGNPFHQSKKPVRAAASPPAKPIVITIVPAMKKSWAAGSIPPSGAFPLAITDTTSQTAAITYAPIGMSVSGGWVGLPAHPRMPMNRRPFSVSAGRIENNLAMEPSRCRCVRCRGSRGPSSRSAGRGASVWAAGEEGQCPQAQAPPHAHPPDAAAPGPPDDVANSENRRRTRSLPQEGHAIAVSTAAVMGRDRSKAPSQARQTYS